MELLTILEERFLKNMHRHPSLSWQEVKESLTPSLLTSLQYMEDTGGEIDVLDGIVEGQWVYIDCSERTPKGRISYCYDDDALQKRKQYKPLSSALKDAQEHGLTLLNEKQYFILQSKIEVDSKTSSWLLTPTEIRQKGGALFGDRRYGRVFIYHNGAESYYKDRGYRSYVALSVKK